MILQVILQSLPFRPLSLADWGRKNDGGFVMQYNYNYYYNYNTSRCWLPQEKILCINVVYFIWKLCWRLNYKWIRKEGRLRCMHIGSLIHCGCQANNNFFKGFFVKFKLWHGGLWWSLLGYQQCKVGRTSAYIIFFVCLIVCSSNSKVLASHVIKLGYFQTVKGKLLDLSTWILGARDCGQRFSFEIGPLSIRKSGDVILRSRSNRQRTSKCLFLLVTGSDYVLSLWNGYLQRNKTCFFPFRLITACLLLCQTKSRWRRRLSEISFFQDISLLSYKSQSNSLKSFRHKNTLSVMQHNKVSALTHLPTVLFL